MTFSTRRRTMLQLAAVASLSPFPAFAAAPVRGFAAIEKDLNGRLGVAAIDLATGKVTGHRQDERFPMCSTFKTLVAAAALARDAREPGFIGAQLQYAKTDLVSYSPVTEKHAGDGMTVAALCAATLQYSDNTAANVLMKALGGPAGITAYARSIGDAAFRLDRWETELNSAIPGDPRDTTTPLAMARTLQALLAGDALPPAQRQQLKEWMLANTTGDTRIRAGVPAGWPVADKTGSGAYGTNNDIGIVYPPNRAPVVIVVYTHLPEKKADGRADVVAAAARAVIGAL